MTKCTKCNKELAENDVIELLAKKGNYCGKCSTKIIFKIIELTGGNGFPKEDLL